MGKRVLLTGATGMVGGEVVSVRSLVRRPSGIEHAKLNEILVEDFCDFTELKDVLRDKGAAEN